MIFTMNNFTAAGRSGFRDSLHWVTEIVKWAESRFRWVSLGVFCVASQSHDLFVAGGTC